MRHGVLVIASIALGLVSVLAAAKKPPPPPCPAGRFLIDPADAPLVVGGASTPADAVVIDEAAQLAISSGCPAVTARIKPTKKFTKVTAKWDSCGSLTKVRLSGKIEAPACNVLSGTLKVGKAKPQKFDAARSTCGDGVVDAVIEECEPGQQECPGGVICQECTCELPPCGAAVRPECGGTCDPGFTCRDIFLVGCACFL